MLSVYFRDHFESIPIPENLSPEEARQLVIDSFRFLVTTRLRVNGISVESSDEDIAETLDFLLRLANYLSTYSALSDSFEEDEQNTSQTLHSSNFVAAQIFEFLAEYQAFEREITFSPVDQELPTEDENLTGSEFWSDELMHWLNAAAHYLLAGHDGNAITLIRRFRRLEHSSSEKISTPWISENQVFQTYSKLTTDIVLGTLECNFVRVVGQAPRHNERLVDLNNIDEANTFDLAIVSILMDISQACLQIALALTNVLVLDQNRVPPWLDATNRALESARILEEPALIWLASLLNRIFREFGRRGLLFIRPGPSPNPNTKWLKYLQSRAQKGRALLWPPHLEALDEDYLNKDVNCSVSMPPGAGKSFIAELRIASILAPEEQGWIVYIVPTNALARQVEHDLREAVTPFLATETDIKRFVTDIEYNFLVDEQLPDEPIHYIAVMTPEKLRLALSVSPQSFETCTLCVVDEAHLIDDPKRGALLDLVIAQLRTEYPQIRFLLLSAMMSNPDELARWLKGSYVLANWRPTRQALMLGIPASLLEGPSKQYHQSEVKASFRETDLYFASVYHSDWEIGEDTAQFVALERFAIFEAKNDNLSFKATDTARKCATALAETNLKTLVFLPHPWVETSARELGETLKLEQKPTIPELALWERLLIREIGEENPELIARLREGVCYHKAAMHSEEQYLSEHYFSNSPDVTIMVSTSTLSYGMNLPVEALIFAGDKRYDAELEEQQILKAKDFVNIAGRAGRPAFASQGLVQVIPNWKTWISPKDQFDEMRMHYLTASEEDFRVGSGLTFFLDQIQMANPTEDLDDQASALATSWYGKLDDQDLVRNTYAFFLRAEDPIQDEEEQANTISKTLADWIKEQEKEFPLSDIAREAFRRSGLPSRTCRHLYIAATDITANYELNAEEYKDNGISFRSWLDLLLSHVQDETCNFFFQPRIKIGNTDYRNDMNIVWQYEREALEAWLNGATVADLMGSNFVVEKQRHRMRWRDRAVNFTHKVTQQYAYGLGSLLFFLECVWREEEPNLRGWTHSTKDLDLSWEQHLIHLPLAAKWGLDSLSALIWRLMGMRFRFAIRVLGELYPVGSIDTQSKRRIAKLIHDYHNMYARDPELVVNALRIQSERSGLRHENELLEDVVEACFNPAL